MQKEVTDKNLLYLIHDQSHKQKSISMQHVEERLFISATVS